MPKTYKELHQEKGELERKEQLTLIRGAVELIQICARNSTSFEEFAALLEDTIGKIQQKIGD